jgi:hypothetical protein
MNKPWMIDDGLKLSEDRKYCEMECILRDPASVLRLHDHWILACEEENKQGT